MRLSGWLFLYAVSSLPLGTIRISSGWTSESGSFHDVDSRHSACRKALYSPFLPRRSPPCLHRSLQVQPTILHPAKPQSSITARNLAAVPSSQAPPDPATSPPPPIQSLPSSHLIQTPHSRPFNPQPPTPNPSPDLPNDPSRRARADGDAMSGSVVESRVQLEVEGARLVVTGANGAGGWYWGGVRWLWRWEVGELLAEWSWFLRVLVSLMRFAVLLMLRSE